MAMSEEPGVMSPKSQQQGSERPARKGGRRAIYTTAEARKQRNRDAQAAFRERRTEHIQKLEEEFKVLETKFKGLMSDNSSRAEECLMLRYKNSLLERILLEHGIDVRAELDAAESSACKLQSIGSRSIKRKQQYAPALSYIPQPQVTCEWSPASSTSSPEIQNAYALRLETDLNLSKAASRKASYRRTPRPSPPVQEWPSTTPIPDPQTRSTVLASEFAAVTTSRAESRGIAPLPRPTQHSRLQSAPSASPTQNPPEYHRAIRNQVQPRVVTNTGARSVAEGFLHSSAGPKDDAADPEKTSQYADLMDLYGMTTPETAMTTFHDLDLSVFMDINEADFIRNGW